MYQTIQRHIPEDSSFHTSLTQPFLHANFKSLTPFERKAAFLRIHITMQNSTEAERQN